MWVKSLRIVLQSFKRCFIRLKPSYNWVRTLLDRICWWAKSGRSLGPPVVIFNVSGKPHQQHQSLEWWWIPASLSSTTQTRHFLQAHQILKQVRQSLTKLNHVNPVIIQSELSSTVPAVVCLFPGRLGKKRPNPKHDHMFKPCPMNPKQDVTAGPPVRVTDIDTVCAQEGYCFLLLWERQRGKGKCG